MVKVKKALSHKKVQLVIFLILLIILVGLYSFITTPIKIGLKYCGEERGNDMGIITNANVHACFLSAFQHCTKASVKISTGGKTSFAEITGLQKGYCAVRVIGDVFGIYLNIPRDNHKRLCRSVQETLINNKPVLTFAGCTNE